MPRKKVVRARRCLRCERALSEDNPGTYCPDCRTEIRLLTEFGRKDEIRMGYTYCPKCKELNKPQMSPLRNKSQKDCGHPEKGPDKIEEQRAKGHLPGKPPASYSQEDLYGASSMYPLTSRPPSTSGYGGTAAPSFSYSPTASRSASSYDISSDTAPPRNAYESHAVAGRGILGFAHAQGQPSPSSGHQTTAAYAMRSATQTSSTQQSQTGLEDMSNITRSLPQINQPIAAPAGSETTTRPRSGTPVQPQDPPSPSSRFYTRSSQSARSGASTTQSRPRRCSRSAPPVREDRGSKRGKK